MGRALPELTDHIIDLRTLDSALAKALTDTCAATDVSRQPSSLWRLLESRFTPVTLDAGVESTVVHIDAAVSAGSITSLARDVSMSLRSLQTRILECARLTAKEYAHPTTAGNDRGA